MRCDAVTAKGNISHVWIWEGPAVWSALRVQQSVSRSRRESQPEPEGQQLGVAEQRTVLSGAGTALLIALSQCRSSRGGPLFLELS
jgi:hypothetical protein